MLHDTLQTTSTIISAVVPYILTSTTRRPVTYVQTQVTLDTVSKFTQWQDVYEVKLIKLPCNIIVLRMSSYSGNI